MTVGSEQRAQVPEVLCDRPFTVVNREMEVRPGRVAAPTRLLRERGLEVRQVADAPLEWAPEEIVLLWGNAVWFPRIIRWFEQTPRDRRPTLVLWHVEPLPPPRGSGFRWPVPRPRELAKIVLRDPRASDVYSNVWMLRRLRRSGLPDVLAVPTRERATYLRQRDVPVAVVPYGYELEDGRDLGLERDVDVLFLGVVDMRTRKRALERLRRAGIRVEVRGDYFDPALWGEHRTELLNRTKIMLSLSRFPGTFGSKRFLIAMGCKTLVVSDPLYDPYPFVPGVHFAAADVDEMPSVIEHYLAHEDERSRVAQRGHDLVTTELTMEQSVTELLRIVGERVGGR
jgi:Glycosyl transferases group 1